jgi:DNA-binding MarR family transcriptional regulator
MEDTGDADLLQELYTAGVLAGLLVDRELEKLGLPKAHFSFLGWIATLQPVTPGTLVAETGLPPTTIRDYVRRLVERGDVSKRANPADGRSYHLVLTAQGQRLADRGWLAVAAALDRLAPHLERPGAEHRSAAREVRQALKRALAEAEPPAASTAS